MDKNNSLCEKEQGYSPIEIELKRNKDKLFETGRLYGQFNLFGLASGLYGIVTLVDGNLGKGLVYVGAALLCYGIANHENGVVTSKTLDRISELELKLMEDNKTNQAQLTGE